MQDKRLIKLVLTTIILLTSTMIISANTSQVSASDIPTDTGWKMPSSGTDDPQYGTITWSNPGYITAEDGNYASTGGFSSQGTHWLKGLGFGFSIPSGATILGIEFKDKHKAPTNWAVHDWRLQLFKGGIAQGAEKQNAIWWNNNWEYMTYGGPTDLWGLTWTPDDINRADFGVGLGVYSQDTSNYPMVDAFYIKVYYSLPSYPAPSRPNNIVSDPTSNMLSNGGFETDTSGSGPDGAPTNWINGGQTGCTNSYVTSSDYYDPNNCYSINLGTSQNGYKYIYQQLTNPGPTISFAVKLVSGASESDCVEISIRDISASPNMELFYEFSTKQSWVRADGPWADWQVRVIHEPIQVGNWYYRFENWKNDWFKKWGQPPVDSHTWRINLVADNFNSQCSMVAEYDSVWLSYGKYQNSWTGTEPVNSAGTVTTADYIGYGPYVTNPDGSFPGDPSHKGNNITVGSSDATGGYGVVSLACQLYNIVPDYNTPNSEHVQMRIDVHSVLANNYRVDGSSCIYWVKLEILRPINPDKSKIQIGSLGESGGLAHSSSGSNVPFGTICWTVIETAIGLAAPEAYAGAVTLGLCAFDVARQLLSVDAQTGTGFADFGTTSNAWVQWNKDLQSNPLETDAWSIVDLYMTPTNDMAWTHQITIRATTEFYILTDIGGIHQLLPHDASTSTTLTYNPDDGQAPQFTTLSNTIAFQSGATNKYLHWTATDDNPSYYTVTGPWSPGTSYTWTSGQIIDFQIPNDALSPGAPGFVYYRTYTCTMYDKSGHSSQDSITISHQIPTINSVAITDPIGDSSRCVYYETNAATMHIGFTVDVNAGPVWDPTLNDVKLYCSDRGYVTIPYCISSSGGNNYYCTSLDLASGYPNQDTSKLYSIYAIARVGTGSYTFSQTLYVYVKYHYTSGGGGGGGGCPYLLVWNGSEYINQGLLDIHTGYNGTDLTVKQVLATMPQSVNHMYQLRLTEHWSSHSYIDQVKLYATLDNGMTILLPLMSATHSEYGNVLPQLRCSDDNRVQLSGAKWNNGTSQSIDLRFLALPSFVHVVSFTFVIEGYNPIVTT